MNFQDLNAAFETNLRALIVFNRQIAKLADDRDLSVVRNAIQQFAEKFQFDPTELENEILGNFAKWNEVETSLIVRNGEVTIVNPPDGQETNFNIKQFVEWIIQNPEFGIPYLDIMNSLKRQSPGQSILIRRSGLVTLVSIWDIFLSQIIGLFFTLYPFALSTERKVGLEQLRAFETIADAITYLTNEEVDEIIKNGLANVKTFLTKHQVHWDITPDQMAALNEVIARRNLFVHNDGLVDHAYLRRVGSSYAQAQKIGMGKRLQVTEQYLKESIDLVRIVGLMMLQRCWRKWAENDHEAADKALGNFIFEGLVTEEYQFVTQAAVFASKLKLHEELARTIIVNHAIALRELNEPEKMRKLLRTVDWKQCPKIFQVAANVLYEEYERALQLLPQVLDELKTNAEREMIRNYPLFKPIQCEQRFQALFSATSE